MRRRRSLTADEVALWSHVTRHVAPMPEGRPRLPSTGVVAPHAAASPPAETQPLAPAPPGPGPKRKAREAATAAGRPAPAFRPPPPPPKPATPPSDPPLPPLERRLRQRLSRGNHPIDAVVDLHGLRQAEAHSVLRGFILGCQASGHTVVLVVTGKGGAAAGQGLFEERGVLRRVVPHWLRLPDLRPAVVGFEEAAQHHGGSGALYVRLRRRGGGVER